ncbi:hypothetical protein ASPTUDRAFT_839294 [Aspergillus tubingensis CBS 134.48]|uniref:Uncharacterized protein n=1 Tax=Aspergillus tubingensis (strain CBS 134.48) TaxID=767770 RepID=A0A1L9MST7_ASPTC|nr:hypothetical protein ASPTUDRAFT_839294 [Aspergillus tubingensis CBS 134.48]
MCNCTIHHHFVLRRSYALLFPSSIRPTLFSLREAAYLSIFLFLTYLVYRPSSGALVIVYIQLMIIRHVVQIGHKRRSGWVLMPLAETNPSRSLATICFLCMKGSLPMAVRGCAGMCDRKETRNSCRYSYY